ncbi:MAG: hypothetical protein IT480_18770 [Gammaproteobacteria bacterium]|nr:hypothetical protein [Gammaproteobacteria bacterium]
MSSVSTMYRYRCDEYAGFNEALYACSVHPIYQDGLIVGAYHATDWGEDGHVMFASDDQQARQEQIARMAAEAHGAREVPL